MGLMGLYSKEKSIMYIYNKVMVMKKDTFMIQLCIHYTKAERILRYITAYLENILYFFKYKKVYLNLSNL